MHCGKTLISLALIAAISAGAIATPREDPATGAVVGRIVDFKGNAVPGVAVIVVGTSRTAVTNANGLYEISRVPAGSQTLEISYLGFEPQTETVEIQAGAIVRKDILFAAAARIEE